jgi:hypothetical protein
MLRSHERSERDCHPTPRSIQGVAISRAERVTRVRNGAAVLRNFGFIAVTYSVFLTLCTVMLPRLTIGGG